MIARYYSYSSSKLSCIVLCLDHKKDRNHRRSNSTGTVVGSLLILLAIVVYRLDRDLCNSLSTLRRSSTSTSTCVFVSSFTPRNIVGESPTNFVFKNAKGNRDETFLSIRRLQLPPKTNRIGLNIPNHLLMSVSELQVPSSSPIPKPPAPTDWVIVEEYPMISPDGIDPYHILDNNVRNNTLQVGNNKNKNDDTNTDERAEKYLNTLERLNVIANNLTLPIALMGLDANRFPSLSNARKACRQGKIALRSSTTTATLPTASPSSSSSSEFRKGLVGDRVYPLDFIARRELYKNILANDSSTSTSSLTSTPTSYDTLGDGFVKSKFQNLPVAYEDDWMAIVVKPAGLLVHPQGKNGSWGRKNNVLNALPYFLRRPAQVVHVGSTKQHKAAEEHRGDNKEDSNDEEEDRAILEKPVPVHRLDFATSGLLLAAKTKGASRLLAQEFEYRKAQKTYTAMVYGVPVAKGIDNANHNESSKLLFFFGRQDNDGNTVLGKNTVDVINGEGEETITDDDNPIDDENDTEDGSSNVWEDWNLGDCFLDDKRATTRWKLLGSHNCSIPVQYHHDDGTLTTGTISIPISIVEMKPKTGRYHQLRRTMSWLYNTPIVGDPIYAINFVEENFLPQNAQLIEQQQVRDYSISLMLCSNQVDVAHPYFNTPAGRMEWETMNRSSTFAARTATADTKKGKQSASSSLSLSSSSLYENKDGVIRVNASISLPKKFTKFISMMERKKNQN